MTRPPNLYVRAVARAIVRAVEDHGRRPGAFSLRWLYLDAPTLLRSTASIARALREHRSEIDRLCAIYDVRVTAYDGRTYGVRAGPTRRAPRRVRLIAPTDHA